MTSETLYHPNLRKFEIEILYILPAKDLPYSRVAAIGLVEMLHHWSRVHAPDGNIGKFTDQQIADGLCWQYGPGGLIRAFVRTGWLEEHPEHRLVVYDWSKYKGWDQ